MVATVEGAGVALAYKERGSGPPIVLVHGMASSAREWEVVAARLEGRARVIAYDRRGYGSSGAPEPYERTTVNEQAEDLAALLGGLDARGAVAAGADLGALIVLDVLRRHRGALRAAVLVDPPAFMLVADATEELAGERLALEEALREGGPARAVELYLGWHQAGPARVSAARERPRSFFADYAGLATLPVTRRELRDVTAPVVVLDGPAPRPHQRSASDALARMLPAGRREPGGGVVAALEALAAE
jgi:pimeloyl-ACP methyl ester carboxylesterase